MKLCKDCKWYRPEWIIFWERDKFSKCAEPNISSLVNGSAKQDCHSERTYGLCGISGKNWEAKK